MQYQSFFPVVHDQFVIALHQSSEVNDHLSFIELHLLLINAIILLCRSYMLELHVISSFLSIYGKWCLQTGMKLNQTNIALKQLFIFHVSTHFNANSIGS